ncbi:MAG: LysE family transporter [Muribaculaceae bacterium]|nr:LysE family transporter [Muribaculaceae bacterium]
MEQMLYILPRGFLIGVLISAPMGPIGMLVIQRTLSKGRWPGMFTGVGASVSDLFYCLLTGFGISFITDFIDRHQLLLQFVGGIVLAAFGVYLFRKNPTRSLKTAPGAEAAIKAAGNSFWGDLVSGFLLTVSNPLILFFIIGLYARFNFILPEFGVHHHITAYLSILGGALAWWYGITWVVNKLRRRFNVRSMWLFNRIIGTILIGMALVGVGFALKTYLSL